MNILEDFLAALRAHYKKGHYSLALSECERMHSLAPLRSTVFCYAMGYFRYHYINFIELSDVIESFVREVSKDVEKRKVSE